MDGARADGLRVLQRRELRGVKEWRRELDSAGVVCGWRLGWYSEPLRRLTTLVRGEYGDRVEIDDAILFAEISHRPAVLVFMFPMNFH